MSAVIPTNPSAQLSAALTWVDGFNKWDLDQVLSVAADDYTHEILPRSLGIPLRSKEEFRKEFSESFLPMFVSFKVTIHEIVESPRTVVFHASSAATSATGHPYRNEYIVILHFTTQANGAPQISSVKEYVDSKLSVEFMGAERARMAAKKLEQENH